MNKITKLYLSEAFFAVGILVSGPFSLAAGNPTTLAACESFKAQLLKDNLVEMKTYGVPLDYAAPSSPETLKIFYWIKHGKNPQKPPLLLIHGGPLGASTKYYASFKDSKYEGDILAIENRDEACSNVTGYDEVPEAYHAFRARNIVRDLEQLRVQLYGKQVKWRVFGQSRGGPIAEYYLEMFPQALESVTVHGLVLMRKENQNKYTLLRSRFNARGGERFGRKFPQAKEVIQQVQKNFDDNKVCVHVNFAMLNLSLEKQPSVCGAVITDGVSYKLSNYAKWGEIAANILTLKKPDGSIDFEAAKLLFQKELNGNVYIQGINYVMGTNGMDVGSPAPHNFTDVMADKDIAEGLISEGRLVATAVESIRRSEGKEEFHGYVDGLNFAKIRKFLRKYKKNTGEVFNFVMYSSHFDTIGGPEIYEDSKSMFGDLVQIRSLMNSGHEGWQTEPEVIQWLQR